MGQTATLFRARARSFANAMKARSGARRVLLPAGLVGLAVVVGLGELAADRLLQVPEEVATPNFGGRDPIAGASALEAAFWLNALTLAFFAFRVMESLFRSERVRAIELLPVKPAAILGERVANAALEAVLLGLAVGSFFVPLAWHGNPSLAASCVALSFGGTLCTAAVTIGTNTWFGANYGGASGLGDAYGGHGGAFIYAPVVSFGMSIACLFMLQLGVREVLYDGRITNAFWLSVGIAVGIASLTLLSGARHFVKSYHLVAAFFREADEVGFRAVMDYQTSQWEPAFAERLVGERARPLVRRHVIQFGRSFPVARSVVTIGAAAGVVAVAALSPAAFPAWAVAILPTVLLVVIERPFARLDAALLGEEGDDLLPLRRGDRELARLGWGAWEVGRITLPYAALTGALRAWGGTAIDGLMVAAASLAVSFAVVAIVAFVRRLGVVSGAAASGLSVVTCSVLGGALIVSPWVGMALGFAVGAAGLLSAMSWRKPA